MIQKWFSTGELTTTSVHQVYGKGDYITFVLELAWVYSFQELVEVCTSVWVMFVVLKSAVFVSATHG